MGEELRPRRVVVVDADNPLREVEGEFFWREDHEVLLEQARFSTSITPALAHWR